MKLLLLNITLLLFFGSNIALAETIDNRNYSWEEKPEFEVPVTEEDFSEVTIKHKKVVEFIVEDQLFMQYDLSHRITYIANETGVEDNNKVYLSTGASGKVVFQKARVINSKGEIIEFNDKDIKEGEDEQSGYKFKYFALDGLDIGSFVEVIFLTKKNASYSGSKVTMQSSVPKRNVEFELISPSHLEFAFLSTNGLPEVKLDTTIEDEDKNHYRLVLPEMEEHKYEELSFGRANLQSIIYKLDANTANGSKNMSSYADVVKNFFSYMYDRDFSKADVKGIEALIKKASIKDDMSTTAKVEKFESYVKENFQSFPNVLPEYVGIQALLKNKASDEDTFVKLYANALKIMGIKHEIVLTSDRTESKFDKDFEANNFLQKAFFYLPEIGKYLSPDAAELRLGFVPWEYTETYALFVKSLKIGDLTTGVGKVKWIDALDEKQSAYNHYIKVDMTEDPFEPLIAFDVQMSGYYSSFLQTAYEFLSDDEKERANESLIEMIVSESSSEGLKVVNAEAALFGKKPLSLQIEINSLNFTEKAGNKVLFKVGELIGEQSELYNEEPRRNPIENDYNRTFDRRIEVQLPDDYVVSNLEKLNFDVSMPDGTAMFKSTYKLEGNKLVIKIDEMYARISFSLEEFEDYKKVINAAADFNKVVLYLTEQ